MMKTISFAQDQIGIVHQPETHLSAVSTPNVNLSFKARLRFDDEEPFTSKRTPNQSMFNLDAQNLIPYGQYAN